MRFAGALLTVFATLAPSVAAAQAELSRLTCAQLADLPRAEGERLILWLHGYYAGAAQKPSLDGGQFETAMQGIREACGRDRALPLIGAEARGIFLGTAPSAAAPPSERPAPPAPRRPAWEEPRRPAPVR
jgi:HdeA/HdeB family